MSLDPIAEFAKLKSENDKITAKIRATAPLLTPSFNTSNDLLGMVFGELKMMRKEMKEMKEDVSSIKLKQQNQEDVLNDLKDNVSSSMEKMKEDVSSIKLEQKNLKEALNDLKDNVSSSMEEVKKDVGVIKLEQQNQKKVLNDLRENVSSSLEEIKETQTDFRTNISSLKCHPTIRDHIFGKWRNVWNYERYFSAMVKDNAFMIKWQNHSNYLMCTFGVKHENGTTTYVEDNKIVQKNFSAEGEETVRLEYSLENGVLKRVNFNSEQEASICLFERIGDPDPE